MSTHHTDWSTALSALQALSPAQQQPLLTGLTLHEYDRYSGRLPKGHRVVFADDHPLLDAPHGLSLALQLLRDDGQLDDVQLLALNKDPSDKRGRLYQHQATATHLEPLVGLENLRSLNAGLSQINDVSPLQGCPNITHLYFTDPLLRSVKHTNPVDLTPLGALTQLEMLSIDHLGQPTDLAFLEGLTKVRILVIGDASLIHDLGPLTSCTALQRLDLRQCLRISDVRPISDILKQIPQPQNRCIEIRLSTKDVAALTAAWTTSLSAQEADHLAALREAMRGGDMPGLDAALANATPAMLDVLMSSVSVDENGKLSYQAWSDVAQTGQQRGMEAAMRLAAAQGSLGTWSALCLSKNEALDHAIINTATGLQTLTLCSGDVLTGDTLSEWLAVPAHLRTGLQNTDHDGVNAAIAELNTHDLSEQMHALLLSRLPELMGADQPYTFSGMDLRTLSLTGKTITAQLNGADLRGMDLTGVTFSGTDLQDARLDNAILKDAQFQNCRLEGMSINGATWEGAIIDSASKWPEGSTGPMVLPIDELAAAYKALQDQAYTLSSSLRKMGKSMPPHVRSKLLGLPDLAASYSNATELQRSLDRLRLDDLKQRMPTLFDHASDMEIIGQYDDETGHELYQIVLGPVRFNSEGYYIYEQEALLEVFDGCIGGDGRTAFDRFLIGELTVDPDEWEDRLEEIGAEGLFESPETFDDDAMREALEQVAEVHEYLSDEDYVGISENLQAMFEIMDRLYRRCAPMQTENETLPMRWIEGRLW